MSDEPTQPGVLDQLQRDIPALRTAEISRALARHDAPALYRLVRERFEPGAAGRVMQALIRTQHDWPAADPGDVEGVPHRRPQYRRKERGNELTDEEINSLVCAADGLTNEETGRRLFKGVETVKTQRQQAIRKLGARNIAHAVAIALRRGLLK